MNILFRKIFSLAELRYGILLLLSIAICAVTFYIDEYWSPEDQLWLSIMYYVSFTVATLWCGFNYVGHIRLNSVYQKLHDIGAYVEQLAISGEDKLELRNYLEDYAADLEQRGMTSEEAAKEAISQFKIKEFLTMSKHTAPFETHGHHYLLGYALLMLAAAMVFTVAGHYIESLSLHMVIATTVLTVYGLCLGALFVCYKVLDRFLYQKLKNFFL